MNFAAKQAFESYKEVEIGLFVIGVGIIKFIRALLWFTIVSVQVRN